MLAEMRGGAGDLSPDRLTPAQRSVLMSKIRSRWTKPEQEFLFHHVGAVRGEWEG